ncbi:MAG: hypothetical protein ACE5EQ_10795 [Phycisphaerae bacterium]
MVKLFAKRSKKMMAATAFLFATAFQASGTCTLDQGLLDLLQNFDGNILVQVNGQGGGFGGMHHGPDDSSDGSGTDDSSDGGNGDPDPDPAGTE